MAKTEIFPPATGHPLPDRHQNRPKRGSRRRTERAKAASWKGILHAADRQKRSFIEQKRPLCHSFFRRASPAERSHSTQNLMLHPPSSTATPPFFVRHTMSEMVNRERFQKPTDTHNSSPQRSLAAAELSSAPSPTPHHFRSEKPYKSATARQKRQRKTQSLSART